MYGCAYVYGGWAGAAILEKKQNAGWVGTACGVGTLVTVAFLASWVSFFREGLPKVGSNDDPFVDTTSSLALRAKVGYSVIRNLEVFNEGDQADNVDFIVLGNEPRPISPEIEKALIFRLALS